MKTSPEKAPPRPMQGGQIGPEPLDPVVLEEVKRLRSAGFDVIGERMYRQLLADGVDPVEIRRYA